MNIEIEVNGKPIRSRRGEMILDALKENGIHIPTLCSIQGYRPTGSCRLCVVEIEGKKELVPACSYPVEEWMRIKTHSSRVIQARKTILELLLAGHPNDCLCCGQSGGCGLQELAAEMSICERRFSGNLVRYKTDNSSPALLHDPSKCVLCGRCIRICEEEQSVCALDFMYRGDRTRVATLLSKGINSSACIQCGQCIQVCPTGALQESGTLDEAIHSFSDAETFHVAIVDPAIAASFGEFYGMRGGKDVLPQISSALRKIGFSRIYDGSWATSLEAHHLSQFMRKTPRSERKPMVLGSCPAIRKFIEKQFPHFLDHLSPVIPGRYLLAKWIRTLVACGEAATPGRISITYFSPCTAFKHESNLTVFRADDLLVDHVLSGHELFRWIRLFGLRFDELTPETPDGINLKLSMGGNLSASAGGFLEHFLANQDALPINAVERNDQFSKLRGPRLVKEITFPNHEGSLHCQAISQTANFRTLMGEWQNKVEMPDWIEVMACIYGCLGGAGIPPVTSEKLIRTRMKAVYDAAESNRNRPVALDPSLPVIPDWDLESVSLKHSPPQTAL